MLDLHRKRVGSKGGNLQGQYEKSVIQFTNKTFADSPLYRVAKMGDEEVETRIQSNKEFSNNSQYEIRIATFRPETYIPRGAIMEWENWQGQHEKWMIMYFNNHKLYPRADIRLCDAVLEFDNGNKYPVVTDTNTISTSTVEDRREVILPRGGLLVYISYNEDAVAIHEEDRFLIREMAWEVQDFNKLTYIRDVDGKTEGIIVLALKRVPLTLDERKKLKLPIEDDSESQEIDIQIEGTSKVEVDTESVYKAIVYQDDEVVNKDVIWEVNRGEIDMDGRFKAPSTTGEVVIKAISQDDDSIVAEKYVDVFSNQDWSW